jgi:hypothetical protein
MYWFDNLFIFVKEIEPHRNNSNIEINIGYVLFYCALYTSVVQINFKLRHLKLHLFQLI